MSHSEQINQRVSGFNEAGQLFGSDHSRIETPVVVRRVVENVPSRQLSGPGSTVGRVLQQLGAAPSDFTGEVVAQAADGEIEREVFSGGYSLIRSARTLHQYDVRYWEPEGVLDFVTASEAPAPSDTEIAERYNDLLAFSYVPDAMLPPQTTFTAMVNPQARTAFVRSALPRAGIDTRTGLADGLIGQTQLGSAEQPSVLPTPFAENLQSACAGKEYFSRSTGPLYTTERKLA